MVKKRGGQPGNKNALKHGFYSQQFQNGELGDLDSYMAQGIDDEIVMLRVITRRVLNLADGVDDLGESITLLGALGLAATRLAAMLKVKAMIGGDGADVKTAISNTLNDILKERGRL